MDGPTKDTAYEQDDPYLSYSNSDEVECPLQESDGMGIPLQEEEEKVRVTEDPQIEDYCKQIVDFMQVQFHRKYDLRSSRKRTRIQEQEEEMPQKETFVQKETTVQKVGEIGKRPITEPLHSNDHIPSSSKLATTPNSKPVLKEVKLVVENKESKENIIEKSSSVFSLQKELEKVKIQFP